jgi:hypothetical protein
LSQGPPTLFPSLAAGSSRRQYTASTPGGPPLRSGYQRKMPVQDDVSGETGGLGNPLPRASRRARDGRCPRPKRSAPLPATPPTATAGRSSRRFRRPARGGSSSPSGLLLVLPAQGSGLDFWSSGLAAWNSGLARLELRSGRREPANAIPGVLPHPGPGHRLARRIQRSGHRLAQRDARVRSRSAGALCGRFVPFRAARPVRPRPPPPGAIHAATRLHSVACRR